jgi:hypothetical protein
MPRDSAVSNLKQASTAPSTSVASSTNDQQLGRIRAAVSSIAPIAAAPSIVLMFQVNETRSRQ